MAQVCCGLSLQGRAVLMGVLSVLRAISCFVGTTIFLVFYIKSKDSIIELLESYHVYIEFVYLKESWVIGCSCFMLCVFTIEMPLYSSLAVFASKGNKHRCDQWWKTKCWLLALSVFVAVVAMVFSADRAIIGVIMAVAFVYDVYLIWAPRAYAKEIDSKPGLLLQKIEK